MDTLTEEHGLHETWLVEARAALAMAEDQVGGGAVRLAGMQQERCGGGLTPEMSMHPGCPAVAAPPTLLQVTELNAHVGSLEGERHGLAERLDTALAELDGNAETVCGRAYRAAQRGLQQGAGASLQCKSTTAMTSSFHAQVATLKAQVGSLEEERSVWQGNLESVRGKLTERDLVSRRSRCTAARLPCCHAGTCRGCQSSRCLGTMPASPVPPSA